MNNNSNNTTNTNKLEGDTKPIILNEKRTREQSKKVSQKRPASSQIHSPKYNKSIKNMTISGTGIPAFLQKNYGTKCQHVAENTTPELRTMHKSYYPTQERMIIIGDLHGDLDKLITCLKIANVAEFPQQPLPESDSLRTNSVVFDYVNKTRWTGGKTFVIQLGDQIDRIRPTKWDEIGIAKGTAEDDEGSSLHIFYLLWHLNNLAKQVGGRVISIMGNHEFMNVEGDYRYVSPHEFKEYHSAFNKYYCGTARPEQEDQEVIEKINQETQKFANIPAGYLERRLAWHPRGIIANFMALNYKTILQVGRWIFSHAGVTMHTAQSDTICKINNCISKYLLDDHPHGANDTEQIQNKRIFDKYINCAQEKSPVWYRDYGEDMEDERDRRQLAGKFKMVLDEYNRTNRGYHAKLGIPAAEYMAVGHSPQFFNDQGINSILDGRLWRCDIGMSRAFGCEGDQECRRPQVLEILNDHQTRVLG